MDEENDTVGFKISWESSSFATCRIKAEKKTKRKRYRFGLQSIGRSVREWGSTNEMDQVRLCSNMDPGSKSIHR